MVQISLIKIDEEYIIGMYRGFGEIVKTVEVDCQPTRRIMWLGRHNENGRNVLFNGAFEESWTGKINKSESDYQASKIFQGEGIVHEILADANAIVQGSYVLKKLHSELNFEAGDVDVFVNAEVFRYDILPRIYDCAPVSTSYNYASVFGCGWMDQSIVNCTINGIKFQFIVGEIDDLHHMDFTCINPKLRYAGDIGVISYTDSDYDDIINRRLVQIPKTYTRPERVQKYVNRGFVPHFKCRDGSFERVSRFIYLKEEEKPRQVSYNNLENTTVTLAPFINSAMFVNCKNVTINNFCTRKLELYNSTITVEGFVKDVELIHSELITTLQISGVVGIYDESVSDYDTVCPLGVTIEKSKINGNNKTYLYTVEFFDGALRVESSKMHGLYIHLDLGEQDSGEQDSVEFDEVKNQLNDKELLVIKQYLSS